MLRADGVFIEVRTTIYLSQGSAGDPPMPDPSPQVSDSLEDVDTETDHKR